MADQRIEKWTGWSTGTIRTNVLTMHLQRDVWLDVAQIIRENGQLPDSYWWEFMRDTYATTQAVAVRRQADTHKDVATLGKLISEIRDDPGRITRAFWMGLWDLSDPFMRDDAERGWAKHCGRDGKCLDPALPTADFDALTRAASKVKRYVDKHVAHADAAAPATLAVSLNEIHDAIDTIGDLFARYFFLLTATSYIDLVPVIQHPWKTIFREPWIRPSGGGAAALGSS